MIPEVPFDASLEAALRLDAQDDLASFRREFAFPDPDLIYMDGNSLGRLPGRTAARLHEVVENEWGGDLIRGWNRGWYEAPLRIGDQVGRLIGAAPGQVAISDSTSVNLFKLVTAALQYQGERSVIVSDSLNFPTDLYILQGCARLLGGGRQVVLVPSADGIGPDLQALEAAIDERTALVTLSHVAFKSGYLYDAQAITGLAHRSGALVLWDLCHSAGALPVELDAWGADLAVGCTYKYLNGGPGSPAYLYARRDLQDRLVSPIQGWFGQRLPFQFDLEYRPAEGIARFLAGTPPVVSLLALEPGLELLEAAGIERLRRKSMAQTAYLIDLADNILTPLGFSLGTPRQPERRGSHVSLRHPDGYRINRALIEEMGVLPDFREPDVIRLGLAPIYTSYAEIWHAVDRIRRVVVEGRYEKYPQKRLAVT